MSIPNEKRRNDHFTIPLNLTLLCQEFRFMGFKTGREQTPALPKRKKKKENTDIGSPKREKQFIYQFPFWVSERQKP